MQKKLNILANMNPKSKYVEAAYAPGSQLVSAWQHTLYSSTVVHCCTVYCTVLFHMLWPYTVLVALSFAHILCSSPILQCTLNALKLLTHFLLHRFHFEICNSTIKFCWAQTRLVQRSFFILFALFCVPFVFSLCWVFSQWLFWSFILLGNNSLQLLGLPPLLIFLKTCLKLTMVRSSRRQRPLRSSFAPMMRRKQLSGSVSLRPSLLRRESNGKNSGTPMLGQSAQASPSGNFRHSWCLQWIRSAFRSFERWFGWEVRKKQVAILFWMLG